MFFFAKERHKREVWHAAVHGVAVRHDFTIEQQQQKQNIENDDKRL